MLKKIESLRKKPKYIRNQYAFYGALLVTGVMVVMWSVSLPAKFQTVTEVVSENTKKTTDNGNFTRALGDVKSNFATAIESFQKGVSGELPAATTTATSTSNNERDRYTIDINAMFASTTEEDIASTTANVLDVSNEIDEAVREPKYILIGTSSVEKKRNSIKSSEI